jgi:hypothetical protein
MAYGSCDQQSSAPIGKAALPPPACDDLHPSNQAWLPDFTFLVACPCAGLVHLRQTFAL